MKAVSREPRVEGKPETTQRASCQGQKGGPGFSKRPHSQKLFRGHNIQCHQPLCGCVNSGPRRLTRSLGHIVQ